MAKRAVCSLDLDHRVENFHCRCVRTGPGSIRSDLRQKNRKYVGAGAVADAVDGSDDVETKKMSNLNDRCRCYCCHQQYYCRCVANAGNELDFCHSGCCC